MLLRVLISWWFFYDLLSCQPIPENISHSVYSIKTKYKLPQKINESSGMEWINDTLFCTHNDGPDGKLFFISKFGNITRSDSLPMPFWDWEELSTDYSEHLYIGDIGNNANNRKWLYIYKYNWISKRITDTIRFRFARQKSFPPKMTQRHYDTEAFFYYNDSLYLFTKSRGVRMTYVYKLPSHSGYYTVYPYSTIPIHAQVTSAAVAKNKKLFAILTYKGLCIFPIKDEKLDFNTKPAIYKWKQLGTCEAVCFDAKHRIWISNEQGYVYTFTANSTPVKVKIKN